MNNKNIVKVVIAGGGTAGWMAAASLSKLLGKAFDITLVESDEIGTVGVGEAAIPTLAAFHRLLGINEQDFMKATHSTFKLGINFENWRNGNDEYMHGFGRVGKDCWAGEFQHFWLHGKKNNIDYNFDNYCFEIQAAKARKFALSKGGLNYSYHLDATLYAKYLRTFSESHGVKRIEGKISTVSKNKDTGDITSIQLENGASIEGQLFIDCTGFAGVLIEKSLHTGYEDWSHWLPCDSAVAVQTKTVSEPLPYTRSIAHKSGWQWRIPLQHRVGNGLVFCSKYLSDEDAKNLLLKNIESEPLKHPKVIKFKTGRRRKGWNKNCVALGLSSGFLEPLESTSIHLIMSGILRLIRLFPFQGITPSAVNEYNKQFTSELEHIRDFIILHYHCTERDDSPFWQYCKNMEIPGTLKQRLNLFKETGRVFTTESELFRVDSWSQVMLGQGAYPKQYHQIAAIMKQHELESFLTQIRETIDNAVDKLPSHQTFLDQYCRSTP
ncbi:tryptophan halogenase [Psychrosphaera saromensis]|uniref:Tryptophan halogenase n=1 Tax=Psychrosphaera saromensis TaxID=716813 RepID=A0A2S7UV27_9GAMM|nr:tryptophan halogenase family protein [Psychrosphaera saromensis]PQJ53588.1 tryptophan halogenase [Psychrosphaera saromensis]GHB64033.1 tryptophan halogenase [Psychrosphaera saromensis]GLQ15651.1 tryptophan halogenase [Psychrosphaera saromensis]